LINDYPGTVLIYHTPENRRIPDLPSKFEPQISLADYRTLTTPAAGDLRIPRNPLRRGGSPNPPQPYSGVSKPRKGRPEKSRNGKGKMAHHPPPAENELISHNSQLIIPTEAAAAPRPKAKPQQRVH
ncbi:MAG: hypothetical protein NC418_00690, partial [Muribaculaceae bacterium]|nr:hypothetical protein [Muribaculaceae bacterium]